MVFKIGDKVRRLAEYRKKHYSYGDEILVISEVYNEGMSLRLESLTGEPRECWDSVKFELVDSIENRGGGKTMGKLTYKAKAKLISKKDDEKLNVEISFPDDLKDLLNKCVVQSDDRVDSNVRIHTGGRIGDEYTLISFKRFKVMKWVYQNCVATSNIVNIRDSNGMDLLFNESILKTGKVTYSVDTFKQMDAILELIKTNLNKTVEAYYKSQKYDMTITINVIDGKDEE